MTKAGLAVLLVTGATWGWAQDQKQSQAPPATDAPKSFDFWMTAKLKESQEIFAALTKGDFQTIAESASVLKTLNKIEGFVRKRNPKYRYQLRAFEFAIEEIENQAEKENIEGVVLGFNQLTISCVHCHNQLRDADDVSP
jgi:cytochrome c556